MRGLIIILYCIIGNEKTRNWCLDKICKASCVIEKEFRKTFMEKNNDDV